MSEELEYTLRKFEKYGYGKTAEKIRSILAQDNVPMTFEFIPAVYEHPAGFTYYERHPEKGSIVMGRKREIRLTPTENMFLRIMSNKPNIIHDVQSLVDSIWAGKCGYGTENLKVLAFNVRSKIKVAAGSKENILVGYRNCGYKLVDPSKIESEPILVKKP